MQNDDLMVVGQGKSDEIPSLILQCGFALNVYLQMMQAQKAKL